MTRYRYTIYDYDPAARGPCSWPDGWVDAESAEAAAELALDTAIREADHAGEYASDDRLWVRVWTPEEQVAVTSSREIYDDDGELNIEVSR